MIRVPFFRGDQVAAGVVVLTALVVLLQARMDWPAGAHLGAAGAALAGTAVVLSGCPREARAFVTAIVTSALILLLLALARFGEVLGVDGPVGGPGALTWKLVVLGLTGAALARIYDAAAATLLASLSLAFVPLAFFGWVSDPAGGVERLLLLVMAVGLALAAVTRRDRRPAHAAQLANAGGVALAAIGAAPVVSALLALLRSTGEFQLAGVNADVGWGWELPLLVGGFGLLAYGAVDRQRGPVLVGLLVLTSWAASAAAGSGSLLGWPIVLALAAAFMLGVGLRPTTPAPPDPLGDGVEPPAPLPLR